MDQKSLQVFLVVARTLSFSRTAVEMHMSVSAVSRSIARLEGELGQRLFDRDRRGMRATTAARRLRPYAERVTAEWRALRHSLQESGSLAGELRIYCSVTASYQLLSPLLRSYREAFPAVDVRLQTGDPADGLERVRQGDADVAMIVRPAALPDSVLFRAVVRTSLEICLPQQAAGGLEELASLGDSELIERLSAEAWILPERGETRLLTDAWLGDTFAAEPIVYARVAGHEAIAAMASLGLGVGIVPRLVVEAGALSSSLALRQLPGLPGLEIGLCARSGRIDDPVVAGFMERVAVRPEIG
ncbi:MAG: HTH-type transcriptional activator IlvY [Pseudomonadota bacterium]